MSGYTIVERPSMLAALCSLVSGAVDVVPTQASRVSAWAGAGDVVTEARTKRADQRIRVHGAREFAAAGGANLTTKLAPSGVPPRGRPV